MQKLTFCSTVYIRTKQEFHRIIRLPCPNFDRVKNCQALDHEIQHLMQEMRFYI